MELEVLPTEVKQAIEKFSDIFRPPPHLVIIDEKAPTDYCSVRTLKIAISRRSIENREVDWAYAHELLHIVKWPETPAKDLAYRAIARKIAKRYNKADLFKKYEKRVMNVIYDALIDYNLATRFPEIKKQIKAYLKRSYKEIPQEAVNEQARAIATGLTYNYRLARALREEDFEGVAEIAIEKLYPGIELPFEDLLVSYGPGDAEEAAGILIAEGENAINELEEITGKDIDLEAALLRALIYSYEWYLSISDQQPPSKFKGSNMLGMWNVGDPAEELDFEASLSASPLLLPGINTFKPLPSEREGRKTPTGFKSVTFVVDYSGSMYNFKRVVKRIGFSILSMLHRYRVPFEIISFSTGVYGVPRREVKYGCNYLEGAKYFYYYDPDGWETKLAPALRMVTGREILLYIITDAEIHDLSAVSEIERQLAEIVIVRVGSTDPGPAKALADALRRHTKHPVRGYAVADENVGQFLVNELGLLA